MRIYGILLLIFMLIQFSSFCMAEPVIYTNDLIGALAESENSRKEILVIFTANWCKYCGVLKEKLLEHPELLDNKIVCYVDYDKNEDIIKEYKVKILPDYLIIRNRIELKRKTGYYGFENFKKWIEQNE